MSTATKNQQPTPHSTLKRLTARHPMATFLVMAYAISWTIFLPTVLQGQELLELPIDLSQGFAFYAITAIASVLGLALPAFLVTQATTGKAGVRDLLRRCLRWRVGFRWYALVLFGYLVATLLVASVFLGAAPLETLAQKWPLLFTVFLPEILIPLVLIQLFEETAWTGFLQSTMQERHGPLVASILVAPAFVAQHLPLLLSGGSGVGFALLVQIGALVIVAVFFRIVIMWLYNSTGRSVLVVALFHSVFNSANGSGEARFTQELISGPAALVIPIGVLVVVAVLVVLFTGARLSYKRKHAEQTAATITF